MYRGQFIFIAKMKTKPLKTFKMLVKNVTKKFKCKTTMKLNNFSILTSYLTVIMNTKLNYFKKYKRK